MKRFLTTLMILLVVVVAGLSALILLVNPNDFRAYMVQQVAARSGYQLKIEGPLRWHVWPQLSILSGRMSLTAPGASQPVVSAENMRLDVALYPLLSHQLRVNQVMLKDAVLQLIPQSAAQQQADSPVAPAGSRSSSPTSPDWSFDIGKLQIVDSVLVFQRLNDEQITVRDINLNMEQDVGKNAHLELSSRLNRDQRDLTFSLEANIDISDYPNQLDAQVPAINYQLQGAGLPAEGIKGRGQLQLRWQEREERQKLSLNIAQLTANDSDLQGDISYTFGEVGELVAHLQSQQLNVDNLFIHHADDEVESVASNPQRPVIAEHPQPDYQILRNTQADVHISANSIRWRGLHITGLQTDLTNNQGMLTIAQLSGQLGPGSLSLPGSLDVRTQLPKYTFQPVLKNVEIGTVLSAFDYPEVLSGQLSLNGTLTGNALSAAAFRRSWQGNAHINLGQARLQGMNFQQLIQQAISRSTDGISILDSDDNTTALESLTAQVLLNNGNLKLNAMTGQSRMLSLTGSGSLNLLRQVCDVEFLIRINDGWQGSNNKLISLLKNTPIPLQIYGPWQQLSYRLPIEKILRDLLQSEVKQRVNKWLDNKTDPSGVNDLKTLLDSM